MDINCFKPEYHDLFEILITSNKLINKSFKRGAPEGPPVLVDVYELQMELRKTTLNKPNPIRIKQVLNYILDYYTNEQLSPDISDLKSDINQYLTKI